MLWNVSSSVSQASRSYTGSYLSETARDALRASYDDTDVNDAETFQSFPSKDPVGFDSSSPRDYYEDGESEHADELPGRSCKGFAASCRAATKLTLEDPEHSRCASVTQLSVICLIIVSTACCIFETVPEVEEAYRDVFKWLEVCFTVAFSVEILLRVWVADEVLQYICTTSNLVDVLAILPWYIEYLLQWISPILKQRFNPREADAFETLRMVRMVRMVRLARVVRLAKAARHSETITIMLESVRGCSHSLGALLACILMGTIFAATVLFFLEMEVEETAFVSIPAAVWWALPTITGVGYGDMVPQTTLGKVAAGLTMIAGILITSLTVAIMTNSFMDLFQRNMQSLRLHRAAKHRTMKSNPQSATRVGDYESVNPTKRLLDAASDDPLMSLSIIEEQLEAVFSHLDAMIWETSARSHDAGSSASEGKEKTSSSSLESQDNSRSKPVTNESLVLLRDHSKMLFRHVRQVANETLQALPSEENSATKTRGRAGRQRKTSARSSRITGV